MDGFAERVAAWVGKGSVVAAAAAAGEDGAPEQASTPASHTPQVGNGVGQGASGAEAGAQAPEPTAASIAVLGSEEGEMGRSERRAPHQGSFRGCAAWVLNICSEAMHALCSPSLRFAVRHLAPTQAGALVGQ